LQHREAEQDQGDVADHRGVGEALAGAQPGVLLGVTEIVSTLHLLCLRSTTRERSAPTSLVARHSQLP
jgi:hypothetical protein